MRSDVINGDCLEAMRQMPDKAFSLAIVDPPYGLNIAKENPRASGRWNYIPKQWDSAVPTKDYFFELKRVSENQIIWGANYFWQENLGNTTHFIYWDKQQVVVNFADGELAWTSFSGVARKFLYAWGGLADGILGRNKTEKFIHPTQKPVALYKWLLQNYAKQGDTILDTHLGSGSSRIAAYDLGFDFTGYELDTDYYNAQEQRFANHIAQPKLFEPVYTAPTQEPLFMEAAA